MGRASERNLALTNEKARAQAGRCFRRTDALYHRARSAELDVSRKIVNEFLSQLDGSTVPMTRC